MTSSHIYSTQHDHTALDSLFRYAEFLKFGELHIHFDPQTGLRTIIAIHSLKLGPAIGGCRFIPYLSSDAALEDAIRLAYMMSYKAAVSGLNHGGAKAVIMQPNIITDRKKILESFAHIVNELGGRYITAVDSGTTSQDMDIIYQITPYVTSMTSKTDISNDPSPWTAHGVCRGIEAAVQFRLQQSSLKNIHVLIQGGGHVGYLLAKQLIESGARVTMSDVNSHTLTRCVKELNVSTVDAEKIYDIAADVFAPCALGAILNLATIERLRVPIVAGSANNQLAHQHYGALLQSRDILYAPDFVINAGGLIYAAAMYDHGNPSDAKQQVENIYHTLTDIFNHSKQKKIATNVIAERIAFERLN